MTRHPSNEIVERVNKLVGRLLEHLWKLAAEHDTVATDKLRLSRRETGDMLMGESHDWAQKCHHILPSNIELDGDA